MRCHVILTISLYHLCSSIYSKVTLSPLSIVGFSTTIRKYVLEMMNNQILTSGYSIKDIDRTHLARPSDFRPEQLHRKVLLLCSYTERDNIMIDSPDVGELTEVYQTVEQNNGKTHLHRYIITYLTTRFTCIKRPVQFHILQQHIC